LGYKQKEINEEVDVNAVQSRPEETHAQSDDRRSLKSKKELLLRREPMHKAELLAIFTH